MATRRFYTDIVIKSDIILANEAIDTVPVFDANKKLKSSTVSTAELGKLQGITSNVQDQIDALAGDITSTQAEVTQEITDRTAADTALQNSINTEEAARIAADSALQTAINNEITARTSGDSSTLTSANSYTDTKISALVNGAGTALDTLKELADALGDDPNFATTVATNIANETSRAQAAESTLQTNIDNEATTRAGADTTLQSNIDAEVTRAQAAEAALQSAIDNFQVGSPGDLAEASFSISNNQSTLSNITGFTFSNSVVRSFQALVSVSVSATSNLYEEFQINGIQKGSSWVIDLASTGDDSGVSFDITSAGQVQYTSGNYTGFSNGVIRVRAITTSI